MNDASRFDSVDSKEAIEKTSVSRASKNSHEETYSADEKKLISLLSIRPYIISDAKGEASEIADRILANKQEFLKDLNAVLLNDTEDLFVKADKNTHLSKDFIPKDLVSLHTDKNYDIYRNDLSLRIPVEIALNKMATAAAIEGIRLVASSTYRSYDYQITVYNRNVAEMGKEAADRVSAQPGTSQHQLGTVVDFGSITDDYANTKAGQWLAKNAATYGWSLSFPKGYEDVTGYQWECWHYRYLGVPAVKFQQKWFKNIQQYMIEFIYGWKNAKS